MTEKTNQKMPLRVSVLIRYLHQHQGVKICKLVKSFAKYSKSNVYRHAKLPINSTQEDCRSQNKGRPLLLNERDRRNILRCIEKLRKIEVSFSVKRLKLEACINPNISDLTVRRLLNREGYRYQQTRKKGLMTETDLKKRVAFARIMKSSYPNTFWTEDVSFYLDGTSFVFKSNPCDQARCSKSKAWRKRSEGLSPLCTAKGKKEGSGGKVAHFIVAIAYKKGVVLCEQYEETFTGSYFASFIKRHFPDTFLISANPETKLFVQDGDPRQNSAPARKAMTDIGAHCFSIPPRSPDINPIENFFHLIQKQLNRDAIQNKITRQSFRQFSDRIKETMMTYPKETIDKTIESMDRRMSLIIKSKGKRLKY